MLTVISFFFNNIIAITLVTILIFGALVAFTTFNPSDKKSDPSKKNVGKVVTIESFTTPDIIPAEAIHHGGITLAKSSNNTLSTYDLCKQYESKPDQLDKHCNNLKARECNAVSCCVLRNGTDCVAGDENGPTFHGTVDKLINTKYFHHKGVCHNGKFDCPT